MKQQEIKELKKKGGKGKVAPFTGMLQVFEHLQYNFKIFFNNYLTAGNANMNLAERLKMIQLQKKGKKDF